VSNCPVLAEVWQGNQTVRLTLRRRVVQDLFESLCIGSDRRSKPDRRSAFERLSPCKSFSCSDLMSTPLRRSLPERLLRPLRLSSLLMDTSPLFCRTRKPGTGDAKMAAND